MFNISLFSGFNTSILGVCLYRVKTQFFCIFDAPLVVLGSSVMSSVGEL